jgi:hypothetical protein
MSAAMDDVRPFLEPHAAQHASRVARDIAGRPDADAYLERVAATVETSMRLAGPTQVIAGGISKAFVATIRDRMA